MNGRRLPGPKLLDSGIVAILRGGNGQHVVDACEALVEAGIVCLEITTNTPGVASALTHLRKTYGDDVELGLGTVRSTQHVELASQLGADFVVAPDTSADVAGAAASADLAWYPGGLTPTEISHAWKLGAAAVKVFPADSAGGPAYLKAVRAPLDDIPLIPTGGVSIDSIGDYLRAGAVAVGVGGPLIGKALADGVTDDLVQRARRAVDTVQRARSRA
jgi:2-dehydro-3-deoxyphosphogluconate aldolase/(4S)-4-hydroxy-2-oxoglutarate aldolase